MVQRTQPSPFKGQTRQGITREMERLDAFSWQLRMQGYSLAEIGAALDSSLGVAAARIRRYRRRHGLGVDQAPPLRIGQRFPLTKRQAAEALERWRAGEPVTSLAREYGCCPQTFARLYRGRHAIKAWALDGDHFEEDRTGGGHVIDDHPSGSCQRTRG